MSPESTDVALFQSYLQALAQRRTLTDTLQTDAGIQSDEHLAQAFSMGVSRLDERVRQHEEQPDRLVNGAVGMGEHAAAAIGKVSLLEGALTSEEVDALRVHYKETIVGVLGFLAGRAEVDDPRIERLHEVARTLGGVVLESGHTIDKTEVKPSQPAPDLPEEQYAPEVPPQQIESEIEEPGILLVLRRAAAIPHGQTEDIEPGVLFKLVTARPYGSERPERKAIKRIVEDLNTYSHETPIIIHNNRQGRAARYVLSPVPQEAVQAAFDRIFSINDALTLATFFRMYSDALAAKKAPILDGVVLDTLLDASPETSPQTKEEVIAGRVRAFATLKKLVNNPNLVEELDGMVSTDDPRHQLLHYIRQIATPETTDLLDKFVTSYKELIVTVAVDRKNGGVIVQNVQPGANSENGHLEVVTRERSAGAAGPDLLRIAADELADPLSVRSRLTGYVEMLAGTAQQHNLKLDRPYSPNRLISIFNGLESLLGDRKGNMTVAEAVVTLASTTDIFRKFGDHDQAVAAVYKVLRSQMQAK